VVACSFKLKRRMGSAVSLPNESLSNDIVAVDNKDRLIVTLNRLYLHQVVLDYPQNFTCVVPSVVVLVISVLYTYKNKSFPCFVDNRELASFTECKSLVKDLEPITRDVLVVVLLRH